MLLDSGVCVRYRAENTAEPGLMPKAELIKKGDHWFGELTVGVSRYNGALQVNGRVDMLIRVWQDRGISTGDICEVYGAKYTVRRFQHKQDEDGLNVTDLELTRLEAGDDLA